MTDKQTVLPEKQPTLRVTAMPRDTNAGGSIFGGWIARARGRVVTRAVTSFEFHQPVFVGDLISCYAEVSRVGRTSIVVHVEVYAQRNPSDPQTVKVTQAELTYVALDENRKPRSLPKQ